MDGSGAVNADRKKNSFDEDLLQAPVKGIGAEAEFQPVAGTKGSVSDEQIISLLAKHGVTRGRVALWGNGRPLREFLWSEEIADACVYIMERVDFADLKGSCTKVRNCHINIGTGEEISIRDLAFLIRETIGFSGDIVFDPSKPDGTMRKLTDPSKLNDLGWRHQIDIEEGVRRMYAWYGK